MKNLTALFQAGELTPKQRVLMFVHNTVAFEQTGKEVLTESDKHALSEGWKPKNSFEVKEYNRYNEGWRTALFAGIDANITSLRAQNSLLQALRLVDHAMYPNQRSLEHLTNENATELITQNSGLRFEEVIHKMTFDGLDEATREDILALCPDAETESQYLNQEEMLAEAFGGKNHLTDEAKEKLAESILEAMHYKYTEAFTKKGMPINEWRLDGFFGELSTIDITKKWADDNGVAYDEENDINELTEKIYAWAKKRKAEVKDILKETILGWLDKGLFVKGYVPICKSNDKETCNDKDTKLPHKEVFKKWMESKRKAEELMKKFITQGLVVENRNRKFFDMEEPINLITGESLFAFQEEVSFVKEYKKQVKDLLPLACVILFLRKCSFMRDYANLLDFGEVFKKLSVIYEIDLTFKAQRYISEFEKSVEQLNNELFLVMDRFLDMAQMKDGIGYLIVFFTDDLIMSLDVKPETSEATEHYRNEFEKTFGGEF